MGFAMSETLLTLLLRLSEADDPTLLPGKLAAPHRGAAFDRLMIAGVIEELATLTHWRPCAGCECGGVREIRKRGKALVAECPLDSASDEMLSPEDVALYGINARRFVQELVGGGATELATPGLWRLPDGADLRPRFLTLRRRVIDDPSLPAALRSYAKGAKIALVGPIPLEAARRAFAEATDVRLFPVSKAIFLDDQGKLRLQPAVQASQRLAAKLLVDLSTGQVLVEGVEQPVTGQAYRLLQLFVETGTSEKWIASHDISDRFSQRSASDLVRELKNALGKDRRNRDDIRAWIVHRASPSAYRIDLPEEDVSILGVPR
jgi:hypothetical protein